jgi:hypothetical protein
MSSYVKMLLECVLLEYGIFYLNSFTSLNFKDATRILNYYNMEIMLNSLLLDLLLHW